MFDVIEHLSDPLGVVKEVRCILKPSGWTYMLTPDISSLASRLLRGHWYQYRMHEHLFYFSPHSLSNLLRVCGLVSVRVWPTETYTDFERISLVSAATNRHFSRLLRFLSHGLRLRYDSPKPYSALQSLGGSVASTDGEYEVGRSWA